MKILVITISLIFLSDFTYADVSAYYEGKVTEVGYEAERGLIIIDNSALDDVACSGFYVDLNNHAQQVAYSTALAAKVSGARVKLRYVVDGPLYYSNCLLFQLSIVE
ncbi:hypothetical protein [Agaribacterium haliotis]|uniref:hypothetical protein n=1 Tax=Agaribacterium haliotis TaxID=2013869 RepID=UPI000BB59DDA|nr:hypothetical protein [Agaribacterium haliotis]